MVIRQNEPGALCMLVHKLITIWFEILNINKEKKILQYVLIHLSNINILSIEYSYIIYFCVMYNVTSLFIKKIIIIIKIIKIINFQIN